MPNRDEVTKETKKRYRIEKENSEYWQWGHPDEWSDAEYYYWKKGR